MRGRVKTLASEKKGVLNDYVVVLSGPLFISDGKNVNKGFLGGGRIPVPTHFFQVIASTTNPKDMEAYIVPNEQIEETRPLDDFKVTISEFEHKTGIKGSKVIAQYLINTVPIKRI